MHAHWWGRQRLAEGGEPIPGAEQIGRFVEIARPGLEHTLGHCARVLEPHWPETMHEVFDQHPTRMMERTADGNGFTLIHGDVNPDNVQVPIHGVRPLYTLDRQPFDWSLTTWLGVYDLSYAMIRWDVKTRRQLENQIMKRYHDGLAGRWNSELYI